MKHATPLVRRLLLTALCLSLPSTHLYAGSNQDTIRTLSAAAEKDIVAHRFLQPKGMNALERYQKILALEPGHPQGVEGLRKIVTSLQKLAKEAEQGGKPNLAFQRNRKARLVQTILDQQQASGDRKSTHKKSGNPDNRKENSQKNKNTTAKVKEPPPTSADTPPAPESSPPALTSAAKESVPATSKEKTPPTKENAPPDTTTDKRKEPPAASPGQTSAAASPGQTSAAAKRPDSLPKTAAKGERSPTGSRSRVEPVTGIEFVEIPGGCFKMGSENHDPDEKPIHEVCVKGFWLGRTEVTNGQFRRFDPKHNSTAFNGRSLNSDLQPVVNISWEKANQFTRWLSGLGGNASYRLPTEAEWEYAARAGSTTSFPWGDDPDDGCRYANVGDVTAKQLWPKWNVFPCTDGYAETAPAGMLLPNAFGLHDMIGNVWEWVADWYSPNFYATSPKEDPKGPSQGFFRIARGGSWAVWPDYARSANRTGIDPDNPDLHVGFRLVMIPETPKP